MDTISKPAEVVTGVNDSFQMRTGERAIASLFSVLHRRTVRLVPDRKLRQRLHPLLRKFVCNLVMYFENAGELDDFNFTNIVTALYLADRHSEAAHGTVDHSTLIRRPNPTQPDADDYFVVGREGRVDDPVCPMKRLAAHPSEMSLVPKEQLDVFFGFFHARQAAPLRGAPRIRVEDFGALVPREIRKDPILEEAFTDVCLSDGAWELYRRKVAA
jgi:hypothetical protein